MKIAFLGTGLMGAPMARRLLDAGHELRLFNRSRHKTDALAAMGARVAPSSAAAIDSADAVVLMVSDAHAVRQLLFDEPEPQLAGRTVLQMSTIGAAESREIAQEVEQTGGEYLEAPVLGSIPQATNGTLIVMVGSSAAQFSHWKPLLELFGPAPRHVGPVGSAAVLKLALNQLIASLTTAFSLSLALVQENAVPVDTFMEILRASALYAPTFDKKLAMMQARDFSAANFPARHLLKDIRLCADAAAACGLNPAAVEGVQRILERTVQLGHGDHDYSALYDAVARPRS